MSPHLGHVLQLLLGLLLPQEVEAAGDLHLPGVVEDVHREEQQLEDAAVIIQPVSLPASHTQRLIVQTLNHLCCSLHSVSEKQETQIDKIVVNYVVNCGAL